MPSEMGNNIKIKLFGQSHSEAVGVVIDGIPSGITLDMHEIQEFLMRRASGRNDISTARKEMDIPKIVSGVVDGVTCGAPICALFENSDTKSKDYANIRFVPRPGHSDFPAFVKYNGNNDIRGGGQYSARLTVGICFAGAICKQILKSQGVFVGAHIFSIADIYDESFPDVNLSEEVLSASSKKDFPIINDKIAPEMHDAIIKAKKSLDSVGGVVECAITGLPAGLGDTLFDSIEGRISRAVFSIPAVKGIEFGAGFSASKMLGSQNNDPFYFDGEDVKTKTNNHGGILGGMTSGMPIIFRAAFKPTPSIAQVQDSVDLIKGENVKLEIKGRHDPCVVPRAVPCVEAVAAITALDILMDGEV